MLGLACKCFMGAIVAGANVKESKNIRNMVLVQAFIYKQIIRGGPQTTQYLQLL